MAKKSENFLFSFIQFYIPLLPVGDVIRCLWMVLELSVLYVRGICQRKLYKKEIYTHKRYKSFILNRRHGSNT